MVIDPISALGGAGIVGTVLAWYMRENHDMRKSLERQLDRNQQAYDSLAMTMVEMAKESRSTREFLVEFRDELRREREPGGDSQD